MDIRLKGLEKGFKQFVVKTVIFIVVFILIQLLTIKITEQTRLPSAYTPFYLVDIAKVFFLIGLLFFITYRKDLLKINESKFELSSILIFGITDILLIILYFFFKQYILNNPFYSVKHTVLFAFILYFILFLISLSLLFTVFGFKFVKDFYKRFSKQIYFFIGLFIIIFYLSEKIQQLWFVFSGIVTKIVYLLLKLSSNPTINLGNKIPIIGVNSFVVGIDSPCSGIDSIFMFSFLYIFAVCFDWKILNKKKVILLFIPGVLSVFLLNILRVYSMILIGAYISRDFALGVFHTNIGWVLFLFYFTIFWMVFYKWMKDESGFFQRIIPKDPLYRNSLYLMLGTFVMAVLGFVFWMINARLFTTEEVGLATTIISVMSLITSFSALGLGTGLIRFLPQSERKNDKINTCFTLTSIAAILVTTIFILSIKEFLPQLIFIKENIILAFLFIFFMIFGSINSLMDSVFIAYRNTKYILLKNSIFSILKLVFPFFLVSLGAYGIFGSWMISLVIGTVFGFFILIFRYHYIPKFVFYDSVIANIGKYSFGNYLAGFIGGLPTLLLPLIITSSIHPEITAYYYMAMMIANLLFVIPQATSNSLFAEGSYDENSLNRKIKKSAKLIALLMMPAIIITILLGKYILLLFGENYSSGGYLFLNLLALSGIFVSVNAVFSAFFRVKHRIRELVVVNFVNALVTLGLSYLWLYRGLVGLGEAWIVGQGLISLLYFFLWILDK